MDDERLSRRHFLGAVGAAVAATAGCQSPGQGANPSTTQPEVTTTTPQSRDTSQNAEPVDPSVFTEVYNEVAGVVASIRVYSANGQDSQGSGFLIDDRHLVTNEHVVAGGTEYHVRFTDTGWRRGTVVGTDVYSDLAVIELASPLDTVSPLSFARRDPPVGTRVVAIGNPFGLSGSVSEGIVSGVDRTLRGANNFSIADAIQTDAAVNPGNSGGPLVNLDGDVLGVINSGGGDNVAFAISAQLAQRVVPALIEDGSYDHSYMGVTLQSITPRLAEANRLREAAGVYIDTVFDGTPSDGVLEGSTGSRTVSGMTVPTGGDIIKTMNETPTPTRQALAAFLALETSPGVTIDVTLLRDGEEQTVELTLGERPRP